MSRRFRDTRLWWRYRVLYPLLAMLPYRIGYSLASRLGARQATPSSPGMVRAMQGLAAVFPQVPEAERWRWLAGQQAMMAREILDVFWLPRLKADNARTFIKLSGEHHLSAALSSGRPVIFYSAHFGRLIMPAMVLGALGTRTSCLTADITNPAIPDVEQAFLAMKLERMQRLMGGEIVQRGKALRRLYRLLKQRETLITIVDAPPGEGDVLREVAFLGGKTKMPDGTIRLAQRSNALLVPYFALETDAGLEGHILPAIDVTGAPVDEAMQEILAPVEEMILLYPSQWWLWEHLMTHWRPAGNE